MFGFASARLSSPSAGGRDNGLSRPPCDRLKALGLYGTGSAPPITDPVRLPPEARVEVNEEPLGTNSNGKDWALRSSLGTERLPTAPQPTHCVMRRCTSIFAR